MKSAQELAEELSDILADNPAIVCVGNDLCGDDAAGVEVARRLADSVPWPVYDTRNAPENFLMKIVAQAPTSLLLIDALHFAAEPGSIRLFQPEDLTGQGPSTHGPAPLAFLDMLRALHPCPCTVLGIQPHRLDLDTPPSAPVQHANDTIVHALRRHACPTDPASPAPD